MRKILTLLVLVAGCEEEVPSCQQAIGTFYAAGCTFLNTNTNPPTPTSQTEALNTCSQINQAVPDRCQDYFDDWKICLDSMPAHASNAQCIDCSQEQDALFGCQ